MADTLKNAQGWYSDPYGYHKARWFSDGRPTALVRDDGVESSDPPPEAPFVGGLKPVVETEGELLHSRQAESTAISIPPPTPFGRSSSRPAGTDPTPSRSP